MRGAVYRKQIRDLGDSKNELAGCKATIAKLKGKLKNAQSAIEVAKKEMKGYRKRLTRAHGHVIGLRSTIRHLRDVHPKKTSELEKRLARKEASNQRLKLKVKSLEDKVIFIDECDS